MSPEVAVCVPFLLASARWLGASSVTVTHRPPSFARVLAGQRCSKCLSFQRPVSSYPLKL